jgi:hypothetical protein
MRKTLLGFISLCFILFVSVQATIAPASTAGGLAGAWGYGTSDNHTVMICSGNVFAVAQYDLPGKKLVHSYGGTWQVQGDQLLRKIEWDSKDSSQVGKEWSNKLSFQGDKLSIAGTTEKWERLDDGGPGKLAGAWIITGNYNNDKVSKRGSPFYPRRTMKVLSGKYFHWIAYNVGTKQFLHAGGGTYTTGNGKYTENIEFFTKTPASVGKTLVFDYSFVDGDWRHKGEKSTGGAMDECWSRRETLEK